MSDKDKLSDEELLLFGKCGIFCGACDGHIGEARSLAKRMYEILESLNFDDVGFFFLQTDLENFEIFKKLVTNFINMENCRGCGEGGNPTCPIMICAKEKGYVTCAECESLEECTDPSKPNNWDLTNKEDFFKIISIRYNNWNQENLKEIKKSGYRKFLDKIKEKIKKGFRTGEVISKEKVFRKALEKMHR
ncbi:MAG: DUF3795 domain-containing protein [Candidatus Lokiarchaeia archaeon]